MHTDNVFAHIFLCSCKEIRWCSYQGTNIPRFKTVLASEGYVHGDLRRVDLSVFQTCYLYCNHTIGMPYEHAHRLMPCHSSPSELHRYNSKLMLDMEAVG